MDCQNTPMQSQGDFVTGQTLNVMYESMSRLMASILYPAHKYTSSMYQSLCSYRTCSLGYCMGNRVLIHTKQAVTSLLQFVRSWPVWLQWLIPQEVLTLVNQGDMKIVTVQDWVTTISCQYGVIHPVILSRSSLCKAWFYFHPWCNVCLSVAGLLTGHTSLLWPTTQWLEHVRYVWWCPLTFTWHLPSITHNLPYQVSQWLHIIILYLLYSVVSDLHCLYSCHRSIPVCSIWA